MTGAPEFYKCGLEEKPHSRLPWILWLEHTDLHANMSLRALLARCLYDYRWSKRLKCRHLAPLWWWRRLRGRTGLPKLAAARRMLAAGFVLYVIGRCGYLRSTPPSPASVS